MVQIQVVPAAGADAYKLLRSKVTHEAATWDWTNRLRTRLRHKGRPKGGYIKVGGVNGILVAHIHPKTASDQFYLAEKFIGRLIAWFEKQLVAINVQFIDDG